MQFSFRIFILFLVLSILFCKKQESSSDTGTANNGFAQNKANGLDTSKRVYVTASSLKVRTEPDLKAGTVGLLEKGDSFRVIEESESSITVDDGISGKWGRVSVKNLNGWVFLGYVSNEPPELLTEAEIKKINEEYDTVVRKCEEADELARQKDPEFQSCSPCGCDVETSDSKNRDKGCKPYKLREIAKLAREKGEKIDPSSSSSIKYFEEYGDAYCTDAFRTKFAQCSGTNLSFKELAENQ